MEMTEETQEREHFYDKEEKAAAVRLRAVFGLEEDAPLLGLNGRSLELLYDHLLNQVTFPFRGEYKLGEGPQAEIADAIVDGLMEFDETPDLLLHGLVCLARINTEDGMQGMKVPLAEIVISQEDPSYDLVEDYCIWFWDQYSSREI